MSDRSSVRGLAALVAAFFAAHAAPLAAEVPRFSQETPVPGFDDGGGYTPSLAGVPAGVVAVWSTGFVHSDLFGQLLDSTGGPVGASFAVNSYTTSSQDLADVAALPGGGFVVVWTSNDTTDVGQDGNHAGVFGQRFSDAGSMVGTEFQINTYTTGDQTRARATALVDGSFVVVWQDVDIAAGLVPSDVLAQRYSAAGAALGGNFRVNSYTTGRQYAPALAAQAGGGFVVVWTSENQDGDGTGIVGARFDVAGTALGAEFVVNSYTTGRQVDPDVAELANGDLVVTWAGLLGFGGPVSFQRFDSTGAVLGGQVVAEDLGPEDPRIATVGVDDFVIVSSGAGVVGKRFDASGVAKAAAFRLRGNWQLTTGVSHDVVGDGSDGFVTAWNGVALGPEPFGTVLTSHACIDSGPDSDGDGIGDVCDLCENAGDQLIDVKPRLRAKLIGPDLSIDNDRFGFSGEFELPAGLEFSDLDPTIVALRIRMEGETGAVLSEIELAASSFGGSGTAGWVTNGSRSKWAFKDKTGVPENGIISAALQDRGQSSPGRARIKLKGRNGNYPINPADTLVKLIVSLGDGTAGECVETAFVAADCKFTGLASRFGCKR